MYQLVNPYHHIGEDLPLFLQLFYQVKEKHLSKEEITELVQLQRNASDFEQALIWYNKVVPELRIEKEELEDEIFRLQSIRNSMNDR